MSDQNGIKRAALGNWGGVLGYGRRESDGASAVEKLLAMVQIEATVRRGSKVVLVEERADLGDDIVYAMLNMFDVPVRPDGTSPAAHGIFGEFFGELGIAFDADRARRLFDQKLPPSRTSEPCTKPAWRA